MKVTEAIPGILKTNPELFIIYGRVAETGQPARFESFIEPLNRWLSISVYSSEKGTFIALFENITERKLAEEALRNNEKLYRAIGESIDYGVWVCDPQGRSIYTSDSFLKLVGMTQEQCSNDGWESALHPAERAATITAWNEFVRTGGVWDMEHRILGVDGLYHPILDRGVPIRGEQGEITAFAGINLDIGKQKKSEAALVLALDRFQRMVDSNIIGIVSARADGSILNSNDYYLDLIGYTQADLQVGRVRWTDVTPPEYLYLDRIALQELTVKGTSTPHEKEYHRPDGSRVWVSIVDTLLPGPEPEIAAFILDITKQKMLEASLAQQRDLLIDTNTTLEHELTERRRAEHEIQRLNDDLENKVHERTAQLATTNKELEAFAYSVSHDLRAPLRGIDGWSLALMEDNAAQLDAQGRVYLERVRAEARRMGQLIDDLLTLSRVTRAEMQTGSVDLSTLAQSVVDRLKSAQPERQVEVVIQPGLMAPGDAALVGVVFTNLFDNAWKFTGKTPAARIEFGQIAVDGLKPYFVRDNGVGFDMQYVNKLFGAFQRLHKMTEFPGTGIGLATVQRIIHRHGGQVWVEAVEGRGATFYFTLEDKV